MLANIVVVCCCNVYIVCISSLSHLKLLDPSQLALCPSQCNEHINQSPQYTIYTYIANKLHSQCTYHCTNANVPLFTMHTAHDKSHCTNLPLYTMHLAHANVSLYTYVASRLASLQIVILPNGANHTNKLQPIRKRKTCIHGYKNCVSYIQVDSVKGDDEIFNLGSKKSFM